MRGKKGGTAMAIGSVQRISVATPSSAVSSATNASKTLQSQLQMKQQSLKKISNDASLSAEEKVKQEQAYQKEIEALKRKLEQLRQKQEEEKSAEKSELHTEDKVKELDKTEAEKEVKDKTAEEETVQEAEQEKQEIKELSPDEVQKILDANFSLIETMIEQGVAYDKENNVRRLTSEIRQDGLLNVDTASKEEELKKLQTQENHWQNAKSEQNAPETQHLIHPDVQVVIS